MLKGERMNWDLDLKQSTITKETRPKPASPAWGQHLLLMHSASYWQGIFSSPKVDSYFNLILFRWMDINQK